MYKNLLKFTTGFFNIIKLNTFIDNIVLSIKLILSIFYLNTPQIKMFLAIIRDTNIDTTWLPPSTHIYTLNDQLNDISSYSYVFILGGDGTILRFLQRYKEIPVVIAVNYGTLGFLTTFSSEKFEFKNLESKSFISENLESSSSKSPCDFFKSKNLKNENLANLNFQKEDFKNVNLESNNSKFYITQPILSKSKKNYSNSFKPQFNINKINSYKTIKRKRLLLNSNFYFLNELVITSKRRQLNKFTIKINNTEINVDGDSVLISTMTGSSAYNHSTGGPLLLTDDCFIINVLNPNKSLIRPLVCNIKDKILIKCNNESFCLLDGIEHDIGEEYFVAEGNEIMFLSEEDFDFRCGIFEII